jgi:K+-transporting ATPase ATPase C chain
MKTLIVAVRTLVFLTVLTGVVYPLLVTAMAQVAFPFRANGSVLRNDSIAVGSELIGQSFQSDRYFWSRPSSTASFPGNASAGSGSNLALTNPAWQDLVKQRAAALRQANPASGNAIPADLLTASGSGLDPHISLEAAKFQAERIAAVRGLPLDRIMTLIDQRTEDGQMELGTRDRVNVLLLNMELDRVTAEKISR